MKLALFSHCAIDAITIDESTHEQIGGAACYGGITARQLKFDVDLFSKFGPDFPKQYLSENKIEFPNAESQTPTTRFSINIVGADRTLKLENKCDEITYDDFDSDGTLVSPIFQEVSNDTFDKIKKNSKFLLVDPQGFLRATDSEKNVFLQNSDIDLSDVDAIKVNPDEIQSIVGETGVGGMKLLQNKGIEYVILTNKTQVDMLVKDKIYSITLPNKQVYDTTGIGDIFCSTFCCTMIREKDFLWALCFAGGAAQAALDSQEIGLLKIPKKGAIETNGSYFYNLVKFKDI